MNQDYQRYIDLINAHPFLFAFLIVWTIAWKGTALWKAAQNSSKPWFVVLLLVNTFGILDIIYVFYFSGKKNKPALKA
jgi:hypothetical protein